MKGDTEKEPKMDGRREGKKTAWSSQGYIGKAGGEGNKKDREERKRRRGNKEKVVMSVV